MHKRILIAAMLVWATLAGASSASAGEYASGFGFRISVPDAWLVLTRDEVVEKAEIFLDDDDASGLSGLPLAIRRMVYDRVRGGELEIFYRPDGSSRRFIDNVNVLVQPGANPATPEEVAQICAMLPGEFSRVFGRPTSMDVCEIRSRIQHRALYLQFDGAVLGTTTLQYQIQRAGRATLIVTATASNDGLPRMMSEFEEMIASIRLH